MLRKYLKIIPFIVFAFFGISPIIVALGVGMIAKMYGFELNEAHPPENSDFGRRLYQLGVAGWYFLYTVPLAICLSGVYAAILFFMVHSRSRSISQSSKCEQDGGGNS